MARESEREGEFAPKRNSDSPVMLRTRTTFFVIGSSAAAHPGLVEQEFQQSHIVENHTWTHPDLTTLPPAEIRAQLQSASNEIEADTNHAPTAAFLKR